VKDLEQPATTEFVGGEGDGYFDTMGRRFKSCLGAAEKRFLVAQKVEQSAAQAESVAANSPTIELGR
jgi:hypothetical protein